MHVHLLVNMFRPDAVKAANDVVAWLKERGVGASGDADAAEEVDVPSVPAESFGDADLVLAIGGDGTLIRAAHLIADRRTPIMGVHYGRFGFVTQVLPDQLTGMLEKFLDGTANIEDRMMATTKLVRDGDVVAELHCLNETVVQRSATAKLLTFDVHVDGSQVSRYPADGVMVATPTGSTAYNLSAGGPVVDPKMDALILTAIMPHTLSSRTLVLTPESQIDIRVESRGEAVLSCDGHSRLHMLSGDSVHVTRSDRRTRLVCVDQGDFYRKLSHRLQWSQGT
ncbi:MAG: NAD(+)/NADH kinase [Armatimonadetes bacterium]|nr:NAD(+)/NADH kinase [Armatimonadota bacterium]